MPADIFVYAIVAAGLIFWLRNILGERHDDEPQRPNPYAHHVEAASKQARESGLPNEEKPKTQHDIITALAQRSDNVLSVENKTAENGLKDIADADKNFDIKAFLNGAQDAFVMIVEAFAQGDRETLEGLLAEDVYKAFDGAIAEREKAGHIQETEIRAIRRAEIIEAKLEKNSAAIVTIRFTAEEISTTKDKDGKILDGDPEKTAEMQDIWVFGRSIKSKDPRWLLKETRTGFDGDNDLLPNTAE